MTWDWTDLEQTAFLKSKYLAQVHVLTVIRNSEPFELDVTVETKGYVWGLQQKQDGMQVPIGFWSQL
jgi:hypothetical protein